MPDAPAVATRQIRSRCTSSCSAFLHRIVMPPRWGFTTVPHGPALADGHARGAGDLPHRPCPGPPGGTFGSTPALGPAVEGGLQGPRDLGRPCARIDATVPLPDPAITVDDHA